jgi:hypothetical protein
VSGPCQWRGSADRTGASRFRGPRRVRHCARPETCKLGIPLWRGWAEAARTSAESRLACVHTHARTGHRRKNGQFRSNLPVLQGRYATSNRSTQLAAPLEEHPGSVASEELSIKTPSRWPRSEASRRRRHDCAPNSPALGARSIPSAVKESADCTSIVCAKPLVAARCAGHFSPSDQSRAARVREQEQRVADTPPQPHASRRSICAWWPDALRIGCGDGLFG